MLPSSADCGAARQRPTADGTARVVLHAAGVAPARPSSAVEGSEARAPPAVAVHVAASAAHLVHGSPQQRLKTTTKAKHKKKKNTSSQPRVDGVACGDAAASVLTSQRGQNAESRPGAAEWKKVASADSTAKASSTASADSTGPARPRRRIAPVAITQAAAPARAFGEDVEGEKAAVLPPPRAQRKPAAAAPLLPQGEPSCSRASLLVAIPSAGLGRLLAAALTHGHLSDRVPAVLVALAALCRRAATAPPVAVAVAAVALAEAAPLAELALPDVLRLARDAGTALSAAAAATAEEQRTEQGDPDPTSTTAALALAVNAAVTAAESAATRRDIARQAALAQHAAALAQREAMLAAHAPAHAAAAAAAVAVPGGPEPGGVHAAALAQAAAEDHGLATRQENLRPVLDGMYELHAATAATGGFSGAVRNQFFYSAPRRVRPSDYGPLARMLVASLADPVYGQQRDTGAAAPLSGVTSTSTSTISSHGHGHGNSSVDAATGAGNGLPTGRGRSRGGRGGRASAGSSASGVRNSNRQSNTEATWGASGAVHPPPSASAGQGSFGAAAMSMDRVMTNVWPATVAQASAQQRQFCRDLLTAVRDVGLWLAVLAALREAIAVAAAQLGDGSSDQYRGSDSRFVYLYTYGDILGFVLNTALPKVGTVAHTTQAHLFRFHTDLVNTRRCLAEADRHGRLLACLPWLCPFYASLDAVRWFSPYPELRRDLQHLRVRFGARVGLAGDRVAAMLCGLLDGALERGASTGSGNSGGATAARSDGAVAPLDFLSATGPCALYIAHSQQPGPATGDAEDRTLPTVPLSPTAAVASTAAGAGAAGAALASPPGTRLDHLEGLVTDRVLQTFNPTLARFRTELHRGEVRKINPTLQREAAKTETVVTAKDALKAIGASLKDFLEQLDAVRAREEGERGGGGRISGRKLSERRRTR